MRQTTDADTDAESAPDPPGEPTSRERDRQERLARLTLERMSDAVYWIRRDGSFMYVNQAACAMLGYTRDELMLRTMFDINPSLSPDRWEQMWQALQREPRRTFPSVHTIRDGGTVTVEISANLFEFDGEEFSCAFARDITERMAAEAALQREHDFVESLIETAPVMIVVLDTDARVVRYNRCAEEITGRPLDEARGTNWLDTFIPTSQRAHVQTLLEQSLSGATMRGAVYPIVTKSGKERSVVWYDQLLSHTSWGGLGLLAVGQDVTEQQELEGRLRQAEKMEAIGRLAGGVAHDFNNQLAGIMGWVEILGWEARTNPAVGECVDRIMVALRRSCDLTSQLLGYSRAGKRAAERVDLHETVHEVVGMLKRCIDKRVTLVVELRASVSWTVGDPTQLGNAVLNLALNARDAMPEGGTLTIATELRPIDKASTGSGHTQVSPGDYIELTVSDTGTGMDTETQRRMFEPFFTTKDEGRGTGLGLAAVHGSVKQHGGFITVKSAPGCGTSIRVLLPAIPPSAAVGPEAAPSLEPKFPSLRVLLVDDEDLVREATSRLLRRLGCQVVAFENAFDAIQHYRDTWQSVDVVVLDMVMPMLDGKAAFQALRQLNPAAAIVLASGFSVDGVAQALLEQGAKAFLQKPFSLATLAATLSRVVALTGR
jgi:two-component system cell cycle sensor histidine kinase/response regulator CckA